MKSVIVLLAAAALALSPQDQSVRPPAQDVRNAKIRELEVQMVKYREATDKLIATLVQANDDLNERVKTMNRDRADMSIRIAKLEVLAEDKALPQPRSRRGLVYRGNYQQSVENLNRSVTAMMRADSVGEARKLLDGAAREIEAARNALPVRRN